MGYTHLDLERIEGRVRTLLYRMTNHTADSSRFKLVDCYQRAKAILQELPVPKQRNLPWCIEDVDTSEVMAPEDQWLADWIRTAVQEVGWVPREVFQYLQKTNVGRGGFCLYMYACSYQTFLAFQIPHT